jgi:hypothetical protein
MKKPPHVLLFITALALVFLAGCATSTTDASGNHDASGPIAEARLGMKIYPGAQIVTSGETDQVVSANLRTPDSPEKVIGFYEAELGAKGSGDPAMYQISGQKGGRKFSVSINRDDSTNVSIMGAK